MAKYSRRDGNNVPVSDKCTFCKINDPNTPQIENREHIYLNCEESVKVLMETANELEIEINNLNTKGYETLIYKQKEIEWEEKIENLFLLIHKYYIFKCRVGRRLPTSNELKTNIRNEISMILKLNSKTKYIT